MQSQSKFLKNCRIHNLNFACRPTIKTKSGIEICIHKKYSRHKVKKSFKYDFFVLVQRVTVGLNPRRTEPTGWNFFLASAGGSNPAGP